MNDLCLADGRSLLNTDGAAVRSYNFRLLHANAVSPMTVGNINAGCLPVIRVVARLIVPRVRIELKPPPVRIRLRDRPACVNLLLRARIRVPARLMNLVIVPAAAFAASELTSSAMRAPVLDINGDTIEAIL